MKKLLSSFFILCMLLVITSCASLAIQGNTPTERVRSAALLIYDGKVKDGYIKELKKELAFVYQDISELQAQEKADPFIAEKIYDYLQNWTKTQAALDLLQQKYPNGITAKKESFTFDIPDYQNIFISAGINACDLNYEKGKEIYSSSKNFTTRSKALDYLAKAHKYGSFYDDEVLPMGAEIYETEASNLANASNSKDLKTAIDYYEKTNQWVYDYNDCLSKLSSTKTKTGLILEKEGDVYYSYNKYSSFRDAFSAYNEALNYGNSLVHNKIKLVTQKLTIKVAVLYGKKRNYPNYLEVTEKIQNRLESNTNGPMFIEMDFIYLANPMMSLFSDLSSYELALFPSSNFGKMHEEISPIKIRREEVTQYYKESNADGKRKALSPSEYEDEEAKRNSNKEEYDKDYKLLKENKTIEHEEQTVTIWYDLSYDVFDTRGIFPSYLATIENTSEKREKHFRREASKPQKPQAVTQKADAIYSHSNFKESFSDYKEPDFPYALFTTEGGASNKQIRQFIQILENLPYKEKNKLF